MTPRRSWDVIRLRLRSLWRRSTVDRELDEELAFHVEHAADEYRAQGVTRAEARRRALRDLGGLTARAEECRDARSLRWLHDAADDVRGAVRALRRRPGFTAMVLVVLALGIGATVSMCSVVYGALLRPMPFPEPDRLVVLSSAPARFFGNRPVGLGETQYLTVERNDRQFESVMTWHVQPATSRIAGEPVRVSIGNVTNRFFSVLGVRPEAGRTFRIDAGETDDDRVVVISRDFRGRAFPAGQAAVGRSIPIDDVPYTVIGVMPAWFPLTPGVDLWRPTVIRINPHNALLRPVIGRLRPDVSIAQAQARLVALTAPAPNGSTPARPGPRIVTQVLPLPDLLIGDARRPLLILAAAVGLVLLIAGVNVASLLIVRAAERGPEMAVRAALGAGRGRLVRQVLVESLSLGIAGGVLGTLVAYAVVPLVVAAAPAGTIPRPDAIQVDRIPLLFTLAVSVLTGLVAGLAPALRASRPHRGPIGATRTTTDAQERLRSGFVIAEVAVSLVLLVGAGLLMRSFMAMRTVDLGFDPGHVLAATVDLPPAYDGVAKVQAFEDAVLASFDRQPSVQVASVNWLPLGGNLTIGDFTLDGGRPLPRGYMADKLVVSPGYFRAMGMTITAGRDFDRDDRGGRPAVVIVSRSVATELWPNEPAVGQRLSMASHPTDADWLTVIGVVNDVRQSGLTQPQDRAIYQPYARRAARLAHPAHVRGPVRR